MKRWLLKILACPVCKTHPLQCEIIKEENGEITEGKLICRECNNTFDIKEGIPRMLRNDFVKIDAESNILKEHIRVRDANISYHDGCANFYERDVTTFGLFTSFNQSKMKNIIKSLSQNGGDVCFLDIGCGTGNCLAWGRSYYKHAIGVDVSMNMLKIANDRGLDVIQADALFLPFISKVFNTVSAISVLHHLYDYFPVLEEICRVLGNDGFFYSDWDPNKIFSKKINQWLPGRFRNLLRPILLVTSKSTLDYNYAETIDPSASEIQKFAEYYHFSDDPGIDPVCVVDYLKKLGFSKAEIAYHWMGWQLDQLPRIQRFIASFFIALNAPHKNLAPLFSIIAKKG